MRTRREQMQAYRFVIRRIVAAILAGDPETLDRPMRRFGMSMFVSVMIGVLGLAAFGIYGVVAQPGRPLDPDSIVIERGTGTTYVHLDGRLHPVLNITSARLILGEPAEPRTVSPGSLVDIPRGPTLGIPAAPVALPQAGDLLGLPWRVCSTPPSGRRTAPTTTVVVDRGVEGLAPLPAGESLYVATSPEDRYLLWNDQRLRIPDPSVAVALRLPLVPVPISEPLVNTVGAGPDLAPPEVPGAGEDSGHELAGEPARIGDVFSSSGAYYLLTADGLARVGEVTWQLLAAEGATATEITASEAGSVPVDPDLEPAGFPDALPDPHPAAAGGDLTVCTAYLGPEAAGPVGTRIEVFESVPEELVAGVDAREVDQTGQDPVAVADRVVMAGGRGSLVQAVPHPAAASAGDTIYLVTDQGIKYPLATTGGGARQALGYGETEPVRIPVQLLAMIPTGPVLSQPAALTPAGPDPAEE